MSERLLFVRHGFIGEPRVITPGNSSAKLVINRTSEQNQSSLCIGTPSKTPLLPKEVSALLACFDTITIDQAICPKERAHMYRRYWEVALELAGNEGDRPIDQVTRIDLAPFTQIDESVRVLSSFAVTQNYTLQFLLPEHSNSALSRG